MNLMNPRRTELSPIPFLNNAFDRVCAQINAVWNQEHTPEGSHGDITARSVTVNGDVTVNGSLGDFVADSLTIADNVIEHEEAAGSATLSVDASWLPRANATYDLGKGAGSPQRRWRNASLSGSVFARNRTVAEGEWGTYPGVTSGSFVATDGATWTVPAFDVQYRLDGNTMMLQFRIFSSSVSGATPTRLQFTFPITGFLPTIVGEWYNPVAYRFTGTTGTGLAEASATVGTTRISFIRDIDGTAWPTGSGDLSILGQIALRVSGV